MRRFTFGTFLVDDANRAAYVAFRVIANLSYRDRQPAVLIAPEGFGKTHLLYSILNRAQNGPARTGVAFVTADDFPEEVRSLIRQPGPIEKARNALLLVDDIHRFTEHVDALGGLIALFLKHGHTVAVTSTVEPSALTNLPEALRRLLEHGEHFRIVGSEEESPLTSVEVQAGDEQAIARLEAELATVREELDHARGENALLKVSAREVVPLRERNEQLQDRIEELDEPAFEGAEDMPPSRRQGNAILEKAAALLEEVQESRSKLAQLREEQGEPFPGILKFEPVSAPPPRGEVETARLRGDLDHAQRECQSLQRLLEDRKNERAELISEIDSLRGEGENLRGSVARANQEREETRRHLRTAFGKLERYESQLTSLRSEIEAYAAEQESRAAEQVENLAQAAREKAAVVAEGLREVQANFVAGLRTIDRMAERLDLLGDELAGQLPAKAEPLHVAPEPLARPEPAELPQESTDTEVFVPGFGTRAAGESPPNVEPFSARRGTLHHIEELGGAGLLTNFEDEDAAI